MKSKKKVFSKTKIRAGAMINHLVTPNRPSFVSKDITKDLFSIASKVLNLAKIQPTKPPFGYYGAKQRMASYIVNSLPPHNAWVEAFCGSAAITLAKKPAPIEVINDLDGQVVNLFQQLRNNTDALCKAISLTPYARDEFKQARSEHLETDPLEKARIFLVATMMTVNGTNGSPRSGFSFSQSYARTNREARVNRWYKLPDRIAEVVERLRHARVENRDARDLIKMFRNRPATLIYLDPPYFVKRNHRYVIDAKDKNFHEELLKLCCRSRCMLLISGYNNKLYREALSKKNGWRRVSIKTHTRDTHGNDYARTEVLWKNKYFIHAKKTAKVPIRLTKQEIEANKINPTRKR
jgi:DNA adenine methylase